MPDRPARVAVIVTPGVGDDDVGATLDGFVDGLVRHGHFATATRDDVVVPPPSQRPPLVGDAVAADWVAPPTSTTTVARRRLRRAAGSDARAVEVDAYEMHWADLSRFPMGLRRILFTLFALILELSRMGREALNGLGSADANRPLGSARISLRAFAVWMALAVVPVTTLLGLMGVAVWAASFAPTTAAAWLLVGAVGVTGIGLLVWMGRALANSGWARGDREVFAAWPVVVAILAVVAALLGLGMTGEPNPFTAPSVPVGLANVLIAVAAWPLRIVWIALVVLWISSAVWVLVLMFRSGSTNAPAWRAGFVALISTSLPAVLLGLVSSVILATTGILALQALGGRTWEGAEGADGALLCLNASDSWTLSGCEDLSRNEAGLITPTTWLLDLFGKILEPLGVVAALLIVLALAVLVVTSLRVAASLVLARRGAAVPPTVSRFVPLLLIGRLLPGVGGVAAALGPALSRALLRPTSRAGVIVTALMAGLIAAIALTSWLVDPVSSWPLVERLTVGADFAGAGSALVAVIVLGVRFLPGLVKGGAAAGPLRQGLDIVWDVANYVRPHPGSARFPIVARYRALIDRVMDMPHPDGSVGYDGLVLASHSQGTVYTAAALFGDPARTPAIYAMKDLGDRPRLAEMGALNGVAMLTLGSPIRQTYERYFPGQYEDWYVRRGEDLAPVSEAWVNGYRPADYVGRAVHADPFAPAALRPGPVEPEGAATTSPEIREIALDSREAHTGYWSEPEVARVADELIEAVAGS